MTQPDGATPSSPPALVRLLFDAFDEFERVAEALADLDASGAPAAGADRLNTGGWIVSHVAKQQDHYWNAALQELDPDPWLEEERVGFGDAPSAPDLATAIEAFRRVRSRAIPWLRRLDASRLDEVVSRSRGLRREQRVSDLLSRSVAHLFAHAGELSAIASLAGAPDLGVPGRMTHSTRS